MLTMPSHFLPFQFEKSRQTSRDEIYSSQDGFVHGCTRPYLGFSTDSQAAKLQIAPASPQPGDILTVTVFPESGEKIEAIGMAAFDTPEVKFYVRPNGSARAFVGLPFDRAAGNFPLAARVRTQNGEQILRTTVKAIARNFPTQRITMRNKATASKMNQKAKLSAEKLLVQSKMKNSYAAPLWEGKWIQPAPGAPTSSAYGRRRYVNGKWWGQHNGADIKAGAGTPVYAMNSGRVVLSQNLPDLRGNCIVIDHGCNVFSIYMHLSKRNFKEGQAVTKGQRIGDVGSTGFSTGPHLHFEVRVGWEPVDPMKVIKQGLSF
jgi:murein DD-endopeptidase MepM/ murein hydrolase activator NlpD